MKTPRATRHYAGQGYRGVEQTTYSAGARTRLLNLLAFSDCADVGRGDRGHRRRRTARDTPRAHPAGAHRVIADVLGYSAATIELHARGSAANYTNDIKARLDAIRS